MTYNHSDINRYEHIQQSAVVFLQRHQARHAGNDHVLFCKTVTHLTSSYGLSLSIAEKLTSLAYSDLKIALERRRLDLSASSDTLAIIIDSGSSKTWAVPVAVIAENLLDALGTRRARRV